MSEHTKAVQRMQKYIEASIDSPITLSGLAEVSHFSPWYSARLFKQYTGLSPADYVRRLRLSHAALMLRDSDKRITDAAFELGFGSVDGFQRAFYREFGCNPKEYAMHPVPLYLFTPYGVDYKKDFKENTFVENVRNVFIQVIDKPQRAVIIKRGKDAQDYFAYCDEVGCDIWGLLTSMCANNSEPVCMWLPEKYRTPGTSRYVQGVEVTDDNISEIPEGFDKIVLPQSKYLMFQGEPFEEEDYCEAICALQAAVKKYNPEAIGYAYDTENPRIQLEPIGARGYIELLPVRPL